MPDQPSNLVAFQWVVIVVLAGVVVTLAELYRRALARITKLQDQATQKAEAALEKEKERANRAEAANKELRDALNENTDILNRLSKRLPRRGGNNDD